MEKDFVNIKSEIFESNVGITSGTGSIMGKDFVNIKSEIFESNVGITSGTGSSKGCENENTIQHQGSFFPENLSPSRSFKLNIMGKDFVKIKSEIFESNVGITSGTGSIMGEDFVNHIKSEIFEYNVGIMSGTGSSKGCENESGTHTNNESTSNNYQYVGSFCQFCDFRPKNDKRTSNVLEIHMRTHTGDKPFSCAICDFSTATKFHLESHMRQHTGEKPFKCPNCEYSATRKDTLKLHLVTHTGEKPFACTECNFKCARKKGLEQHWKFHCKFEHFRCSVCDYKCRKSIELKHHLLTHPRNIPCPKCDYMGWLLEDLEKHNSIHHKEIVKIERKVRKRRKEWSCSKCGKLMTLKNDLRKHVMKNECVKP